MAAKNLVNVAYRWLSGSELDILDSFIKERHWTPLNKPLTRALVAFDEHDAVIGYFAVPLMPVLGPSEVIPEWRGSGLFEEMAATVHETLANLPTRGLLMVADNPFSEKLAIAHGLTRLDSPVYTNGVQ
jgi:hypothetical protein